MTPGEQIIWAAEFVRAYGSYSLVEATRKASAVVLDARWLVSQNSENPPQRGIYDQAAVDEMLSCMVSSLETIPEIPEKMAAKELTLTGSAVQTIRFSVDSIADAEWILNKLWSDHNTASCTSINGVENYWWRKIDGLWEEER